MTRQEMKRTAKARLSGNYGIAIGAWLLSSIILSAASGMTMGLSSIFSGVLTFGLTGVYICIVRTGSAKLETLFTGFSHFLSTFLAGFLQSLFITLWTLLFIIPGIVKTYSYAMTFYILNDNPEMSGNDAITESRKMMDGHKWELFVLDLSFIGWHILAVLTFGLLYLYVTPYVQATRAQFYESLKAQNASDFAGDTEAEPTPESESEPEVTEL